MDALFEVIKHPSSKRHCRDFAIRDSEGRYIMGNPGHYTIAHRHDTVAQPAHFMYEEGLRFIRLFMTEGFSANPRRIS